MGSNHQRFIQRHLEAWEKLPKVGLEKVRKYPQNSQIEGYNTHFRTFLRLEQRIHWNASWAYGRSCESIPTPWLPELFRDRTRRCRGSQHPDKRIWPGPMDLVG